MSVCVRGFCACVSTCAHGAHAAGATMRGDEGRKQGKTGKQDARTGESGQRRAGRWGGKGWETVPACGWRRRPRRSYLPTPALKEEARRGASAVRSSPKIWNVLSLIASRKLVGFDAADLAHQRSCFAVSIGNSWAVSFRAALLAPVRRESVSKRAARD